MKRKVIPMAVPKVGDEIYVPSDLSRAHSVMGGIAKVTNVTSGMSAGKMVPFMEVAEHPGRSYNWHSLAADQDWLRTKYGQGHALPYLPAVCNCF